MRASLLALSFALTFAFVSEAAIAHGGSWSPPPNAPVGGGNRPGNPGKPRHPKKGGDTTPPNTPAPTTPSGGDAPTTPGAGAPTTPPMNPPTPSGGPKPGGPTTGNAPPTAPATRGGPSVGSRRSATGSDRWESWWAYTRELYLGRHVGAALGVTTRRVGDPNAASGASGSRASLAAPGSLLLPDAIRRDLLPVLAGALRDESTEVADSAAIALGRAVSAAESGPILPLLVKNLAHEQRSPQQAAVLALGILGGPEAVDRLRQVVLDTPAGRQLCGATGPLDEMLRGLAALSLGLTGAPDALAPLVTLVTTPTVSRELAAAAVVGIGLQRESAPAAVVALAKLLDDRSLDREVRAQVPIAIARLPASSARGMLPKFLDLLTDKKTSNELSRSLALALGHVATPEDDEAVQALVDVAKRDDDASTREFALLALGRIFERGGADAVSAKARDSTHAFLLDQLTSPSQRSQKPWAALALGLLGRGDPSCGSAAPSQALALSSRRMIELFEQDSDPSLQGAIAISLGLVRAPGAAALLRTRLTSTANPGLRGHLATALGLLKDAASIEPMRRLLSDPALPPATRIDVARGLALAGDTGFESRLLELLDAADDVPSAAAYAKALGLVGSRSSAEALCRMAEDASRPDIQRGFAVVALGLLAEKTPLPWNVPFLVDANFTLALRPLEEILDLL